MSFIFYLLEKTLSNKESKNVISEPLIPVRLIYFVKAGVVMCKGAEMIEI